MGNPFVDFGILAGAGAPTRSFKAGDIIFRQGDPAEELYVVKSGKVDITPRQSTTRHRARTQHFRRNGAD
jgi:CRP-like cAMP-binding protein